jgi:uncharacterized protein YbbC (DUF1343 family)
MARMTVRLGSERLLASSVLDNQRVGVVANPASIDGSFCHIVDRLASHPSAKLAAIFGPQHGFRADVQDNMIESPHGHDPLRRVPVYSLYSETREPTAEMLDGLDLLVIDLQDVGARIYTFIYTMANCMKAAARHGVRVIVCDRPNPIGGEAVEGPVLERGFESFVGLFPIPMRHGMTVGELARLFNEEYGLGADLEVVPMEGWQRGMYWDDAGLPWVLPSPNMPTLDTAIVYPGAVLFEGTQLSEGRGTTRPFEILGAPWIDAEPFAAGLNAQAIEGAYFRPVVFEPTFHKHAHRACGGVQIHVTDRRAFRPVLASVAVLGAFHDANPERFAWRQPPYEYEDRLMPIDILAGSEALRKGIEAGRSFRDIAEEWEEPTAEFERTRRRYLLY